MFLAVEIVLLLSDHMATFKIPLSSKYSRGTISRISGRFSAPLEFTAFYPAHLQDESIYNNLRAVVQFMAAENLLQRVAPGGIIIIVKVIPALSESSKSSKLSQK